ncbi:hypothetical protein B9Z55_018569 [Caenorhabditis nigoni]|uniref:Nuclear receptor domain-containing protein n=1 Tax=Caenorhabditis nigoni TaxID=1611254 RepID=A0A2G5TET6_9PELO|nr:hypothetical protein B9Z55_018569 [Caenorhabditis nigoni]
MELSHFKPSSSSSALPEKCVVCNRTAHGFHCDVATCKGCKTFFRRQLLSGEEAICDLRGDCYDLTKRREPLFRCRPCRFQKCVSVGMNPLALNFQSRTIPPNCEENRFQTTENLIHDVVGMLLHLESKVEKFRKCSYNPNWQEIDKIQKLLNSTNKLSMADSYGEFPDWPIQSDPRVPLKHNYFQTYYPQSKHWWFFNLLTLTEYIRTLWFFDSLDLQDQLLLIRHAVVGITLFHISYFTIQNKCQYLTQPDGSQHPHNTMPDYKIVSMLVDPMYRLKIQNEESLLLKLLFVCNPAISGLSNAAQVLLDKERSGTSKILFDYCLRNKNCGPARYVELIGLLGVMEVQQKKLKDIYLYSFGPLLAKLPKECTIAFVDDIFQ